MMFRCCVPHRYILVPTEAQFELDLTVLRQVEITSIHTSGISADDATKLMEKA